MALDPDIALGLLWGGSGPRDGASASPLPLCQSVALLVTLRLYQRAGCLFQSLGNRTTPMSFPTLKIKGLEVVS